MGAKESGAMIKARKLIMEKGVNPAQAAKKVGLTRSAIYVSKWYKEWKSKLKG